MATAAAAMMAEVDREIQHRFFSADAVRADRAIPFVPAGATEARLFRTMEERGIIRREGIDRYWIDVVAYDREVRRQHRQSKIALVALSVVLAVALIVHVASTGHFFRS